MIQNTQKFLVWLAKAMAWLAGASLVGMVAIVVVDVLGRHLIPGFSINGGIELAVICVILLAYFGLPWAFASGAHIMVELATAGASEKFRRRLDAFWLVVSASVAGVFCWLVLNTGIALHGYGQVSEILRMSPLITYGAGAVGLAVTIVVALNTALVKLRDTGPEEKRETTQL